jgi:hypothetical protein
MTGILRKGYDQSMEDIAKANQEEEDGDGVWVEDYSKPWAYM